MENIDRKSRRADLVSETPHEAQQRIAKEKTARPVIVAPHMLDRLDNSRADEVGSCGVEAARPPIERRAGLARIGFVVLGIRSEARRVREECVSNCRYGWEAANKK